MYALGVTLYKLLGGQERQEAPLSPTTVQSSLAAIRRDLPTPLVGLVQRMVALDPKDRVTTAAAIADALTPFAAGSTLDRLLESKQVADDAANGYDSQQPRIVEEPILEGPNEGDVPVGAFPRRMRLNFFLSIAACAALGMMALALQSRDTGAEGTTDEAGANTIDADRHVAEWVLSLGGLVGPDHQTVWRSKGDLPNAPYKLAFVNLSDTAVTDDDLAELKGLSRLNALALNADNHPSRLTAQGLRHLREIKSLTYLGLYYVPIGNDGLRHLAELESIEIINLSGTGVTDDGLKHLSRMTRLKSVSLSDTQISGIGLTYLKDCRTLETLYLGRTKLDDDALKAMPSWPKLSTLHLESTAVRGNGLSSLARYRSLQWINASDLKLVIPNSWDFLERMKKLSRLSLNNNPITVTDDVVRRIAVLPKLTELNVENTSITAAGVRQLADVKSLRILNLRGNSPIPIEAVAELKRSLPDCTVKSDFSDAHTESATK